LELKHGADIDVERSHLVRSAHCARATYRADARLRCLRVAVSIAFLFGIGLSPRLWLSTAREYPLVPIFQGLPHLGAPLDVILLAALAASLVAVIGSRTSRIPVVCALVLALALAALDENRWQPWAYQYVLMLAAFLLASPTPREGGEQVAMRAVGLCGLVLVAIYFWSGLSKINAAFRLDVFPFLLKPLADPVRPWLAPFAYAVPAAEMCLGLGLAWRRSRPVAVIGAVLMHGFILFSIGPLGNDSNSVVWPWNAAMVAFVILVFWGLEVTHGRPLLADLRHWPRRSRALAASIALLVCVMPALNLFGKWDSYLSAALYSGASIKGVVLPSPRAVARWPVSARRHVIRTASGPALFLLDWAIDDLNVPAYPARRVFERVAGNLCAKGGDRRALTLVVQERPDVLSGRRTASTYTCDDLRASGVRTKG